MCLVIEYQPFNHNNYENDNHCNPDGVSCLNYGFNRFAHALEIHQTFAVCRNYFQYRHYTSGRDRLLRLRSEPRGYVALMA